jgi:hypothetical protein
VARAASIHRLDAQREPADKKLHGVSRAWVHFLVLPEPCPLDALRLANVRSLVDTGFVDIKPITLLVGTNSSGKSSFLRAFPLLKQSIETATSSPILWFGRYVDFGSIEDATYCKAPAPAVTFGFRFTIAQPDNVWQFRPWPIPGGMQASVNLTLVPTGTGSRVSACEILILEKIIALEFDDFGKCTAFTINGHSVLPTTVSLRLSDAAVLVPSLTSEALPEGERAVVYQPYSPHTADPAARYFRLPRTTAESVLADEVSATLRKFMRSDLSNARLHDTLLRLPLASDAELVSQIDRHVKGRSPKALSSRSPEAVKTLIAQLWAQSVPYILRSADSQVSQFVANSTYMGPLRATAQRYYRAQDLSVREVDFRGENLAMFLRSLSESEQHSLSDFTKRHFGFEVSRDDGGGHVAIRVRANDAPDHVNLADAGFGYSQMLPLIALMWSTYARAAGAVKTLLPKRPAAKTLKPPSLLVAIEQPELHLHPAHQSRLADMFVTALSAAKAENIDVRLVVETHSEAIVNRLGELIKEKRAVESDVQIAVFEHDEAAQATQVRFAGYDADGSLKDWPFGFFAP